MVRARHRGPNFGASSGLLHQRRTYWRNRAGDLHFGRETIGEFSSFGAVGEANGSRPQRPGIWYHSHLSLRALIRVRIAGHGVVPPGKCHAPTLTQYNSILIGFYDRVGGLSRTLLASSECKVPTARLILRDRGEDLLTATARALPRWVCICLALDRLECRRGR